MSEKVYVVTSTDLGWDCIIRVFYNEEDAIACCKPEPEEYEADKEFYDQHLNEDGMFDTYIIHSVEIK